MPVATGLQANGPRRRAERQTSSCTECRRRKQKCSQGQPCTNCVRRFPQPICEYKGRTPKRPRQFPPGILPAPSYSTVALKEGPYSHLTLFGVQDAILQVEDTPVSADSPESVTSHSSSDRSTSPTSPTEAPPTPFVPFKVSLEVENDLEEKLESLRVIFERRLSVANRIPDDQSAIRNAETVLAVHARRDVQSPIESAMDQFRYLPMVPTRMNKELVRIHLQLLCRFKVSIAGSPAPNNPFMKHWVPFCVQDPLLLQIVLFTSACFLAETGHIPKSLALMHKGAAYQMLNYHLRNGETQTSDAAVLGVAQMVVDSWYWGGTLDLQFHITGLKQMISLRGGLQNLGMHGYISKTILIHDVVMALAHEIKPCIYGQPGFEFDDPILMPFQIGLNSPLISGWPTFVACANSLQLSFHTAQILDHIRFLIEMVLALPEDAPIERRQALLVAAVQINDQLAELPEDLISRRSVDCSSPASEGQSPGSHRSARSDKSSPPVELPDLMYRCVRLTAMIYCRSILNQVPTSQICTEMNFYQIWQLVWQLGLPTWNANVGIFVWIMLAIVPSCHKTGPARFIKTLMVAGFMTIAVDNWHIALDVANQSFKLQEWLAEESIDETEKGLSGGEHIVEKYGFALKEILPDLQLPADNE